MLPRCIPLCICILLPIIIPLPIMPRFCIPLPIIIPLPIMLRCCIPELFCSPLPYTARGVEFADRLPYNPAVLVDDGAAMAPPVLLRGVTAGDAKKSLKKSLLPLLWLLLVRFSCGAAGEDEGDVDEVLKKSKSEFVEAAAVGVPWLWLVCAGADAVDDPKKSSSADAGVPVLDAVGELKKSNSESALVVRAGAEEGPDDVAGPKSKSARTCEGFFGCWGERCCGGEALRVACLRAAPALDAAGRGVLLYQRLSSYIILIHCLYLSRESPLTGR
mmetsp:Transcript_46914/g.69405  ORF Transcript_46914/g.69405 Transcript_46914/m.69405 type:complete len:274 (+) Transcript_46914:365-1186(+)